MRRIVRLAGILGWVASGLQAAPVSLDPVVVRLENSIRRYSEAGRLTELRSARLELAGHARRSGSYLMAARQYELLLASRPPRQERVILFIELGRMHEAIQDYRGAIASYEDALHDDAKSFDARMLLGRACAKVDLFKPAEEAFTVARKLRPRSHEPLQGIAELYAKRGYPDKAADAYRQALALEPAQVTGTLGLADCYMKLSDFTRAQEVLERASAIASSTEFHLRLGELHRRQGHFRKAVESLEKALKDDATRGDIRLNLAMLYAQLGRLSEADRAFDSLLKTYPQSPLVRFLNAWVLFERGDRSGARRQALEARRLSPTTLVRHYNDQLLERLENR